MFARLVDRLFDVLWDVTLPLSSRCPVCAFWRGVLGGAVLAVLAGWVQQ